jgi:hypothetical protein
MKNLSLLLACIGLISTAAFAQEGTKAKSNAPAVATHPQKVETVAPSQDTHTSTPSPAPAKHQAHKIPKNKIDKRSMKAQPATKMQKSN